MRASIISLTIFSLLFTACSALAPAPTPEPVTLRFAFIGREVDYRGMADKFQEKYPSITVELDPISLQQRGLEGLTEAFDEADVVRANINFLGQEQIAAMSPLDGYLTADQSFPKDDFFPGSLAALQYRGEQLGIPAGLDPMVMFYENLRFKITGATPLTTRYTLEDFLAVALAINNQNQSDRDEGKFAYGFCTNPLSNDPVMFAYLFGGGIVDRVDDPTRPTLNSPENVEAVIWYASLWNEYEVTPPISDNPFETFQLVSSISCGFWMQWFDMFGFLDSLATEPGMLPLPKVKAPFSIAILDGYFIPQKAGHPKEAWQWISFLLQYQEASLGQIPPLMGQIASESYAQRVPADALVIARGLTRDTYIIGLQYQEDPRLTQVGELFTQAVRQVIEGQADAQSALEEAQLQAEKIFIK